MTTVVLSERPLWRCMGAGEAGSPQTAAMLGMQPPPELAGRAVRPTMRGIGGVDATPVTLVSLSPALYAYADAPARGRAVARRSLWGDCCAPARASARGGPACQLAAEEQGGGYSREGEAPASCSLRGLTLTALSAGWWRSFRIPRPRDERNRPGAHRSAKVDAATA